MQSEAERVAWSDWPRVVVATYRSDVAQLHVGIVYRLDPLRGQWTFLHQAFHLYTRADEWTGGRCRGGVWAELQMPEEELDVLIDTCEIVRDRYTGPRGHLRGLPYAVRYEGGGFDAAGNLRLVSTRGWGLTCATFVLALCERLGHRLLDLSSWPPDRPGDKEWHDTIVAGLEQHIRERGSRPDDLAHLETVRGEIPCARYRPEEVVAGVALFEGRSVHFDAAAPLGVQIEAFLPPYAPR